MISGKHPVSAVCIENTSEKVPMRVDSGAANMLMKSYDHLFYMTGLLWDKANDHIKPETKCPIILQMAVSN